MSRPQQVAEYIREVMSGWPPPESNAEAYQQMQAAAELLEALQMSLSDIGEAVADLGSLKPKIPEAIHEASDGVGSVAEQLRDLPPPPPPRPGEDQDGDEANQAPEWVQPSRIRPWHSREAHPLPPLPGTLRPPSRRGPPPDTHQVFVPGWYEPGSKPVAAMSDRELRRRVRRARKNAEPRKEPGQWWRKWGQIIDSKIP